MANKMTNVNKTTPSVDIAEKMSTKLPAWAIILFVAIMVLALWVGIFIALWAFVRMGGWI